jgi:hypothetical protein
MSKPRTITAFGGCDLVVQYPHQPVVFGLIQSITYVVDEETTAVQGTLVFDELDRHPNGAMIKIDMAHENETIKTIQMYDCTFSDQIALHKTVQFVAARHSEVIR